MSTHIYLDHAATSPLLPEVLDAMLPWMSVPANPASAHALGRRASSALEGAREQVAALLGRSAAGIVFVSGATEGNHTAVRGLWALGARRFAASAIEHPSVLGALALAGAEIVSLPAGPDGLVDLSELTLHALSPPVDAIVLQSVNHELGTIQPVEQASQIASSQGLLLHVDATQGAGKIPLVGDPDTAVLSSHKLGGPVGIGALSLRSGDRFPALLTGGSQERRRRAGTVNVAGAVGFGLACAIASREQVARVERYRALAEVLRSGLVALGARLVIDHPQQVPSITTFTIPQIRGDLLVQTLDLRGVAVSSGAACASGSTGPSPVLSAIGHPEPAGGVRVSFGPSTTRAEVDEMISSLAAALPAIRAASSWETADLEA